MEYYNNKCFAYKCIKKYKILKSKQSYDVKVFFIQVIT